MDDEIDRNIDVTAILFLLVQIRHHAHDWTLIGSGANVIGIQAWVTWNYAHNPFKLVNQSTINSYVLIN